MELPEELDPARMSREQRVAILNRHYRSGGKVKLLDGGAADEAAAAK
jgi:hypothetical protein